MGTTRVRIDPDDPFALPDGRIDVARVDATTEAEISAQEREDKGASARKGCRDGVPCPDLKSICMPKVPCRS